MGASISFDSKYRLILDTEIECISTNTRTPAADKKKSHRGTEGNGSESGDSDDSGDSGDSGESDSDSGGENDNKTYTVKITPEIIGYIRSYLRKNQFLDEFDLITEMDLVEYNHAPDSALVFNSDSIVFNTTNQTIEAVGEWEYLEPEKPAVANKKSKSKSKGSRSRDNDDDDDDHEERDDVDNNHSNYKTKDDELPVSEIEGILKDKFEEYNKTREFVIHESKNSFLAMLIKSVEIVKA
jgi:hypothetical protein